MWKMGMDDDGGKNVLHHTELTNIQFFEREEATLVMGRCAGKPAAFRVFQLSALTASLQHF